MMVSPYEQLSLDVELALDARRDKLVHSVIRQLARACTR
jgi:hypothetical protein